MNSSVIDNETGETVLTAAQLDGVRTARVIAFLVDYIFVAILCIPAAIVVFLLGIPTLGLAWGLFPFLIPVIAVIYVAITMGGPAQATIGMRMNGLRAFKVDGGSVGTGLAGLHHILFLVIQGIAVFLPLLVSLFSPHKRLLHDIALGTYIARDLS